MSEEDAKAGKKFEQAFGDLSDVLKSSVEQIGGALVPMIRGLTNLIVPVVAAVRDWIKRHQALTIGIFVVTGAIVAAGIALKGFAIAMGMVSAVVGVYKAVVALATIVTAIFEGVLAVLASPVLLIGAAVLGLIGYITYLTGAFSAFIAGFKGFGEETSGAIKAIANAIANGNLQAAWDVVTAYLEVGWQRMLIAMEKAWDRFKAHLAGAASEVGIDFANAALSSGPLALAGPALDVVASAAKEQIKNLTDDLAAQQEVAPNPELTAAEGRLAEKQKALAAAMADANKPSPADKDKKSGYGGLTPVQQGAVAGTFSGAVAGMLGGGSEARANAQLRYTEDQLRAANLGNQHLADLKQEAVRTREELSRMNGVV